jgi:predicted Zn-dependent protease
VLVGACDAPSIPVVASGYDPESLVPFIYHWSAGHDIAIYVDTTDATPDADLPGSVQGAIAAWEPVGRLGEVRLHTVTDVHAADVIVHFMNVRRLIISPDDPNNPGTSLCDPQDTGSGFTWICVTSDLHAVEFLFTDGSDGHVKMDVAVSRTAVPDLAAFRSVVMHEIGHVLGIGAHSPNIDDLMFIRPRAPAPTEADAQTLRFILSQRADVRF